MDKQQEKKIKEMLKAMNGRILLSHDQAKAYGIETTGNSPIMIINKERNKVERYKNKLREKLTGMDKFIMRV